MSADRGDDLAQRTLALVDIPSESHDEAAALAHVRGVMAATGVPLQLDTGSALALRRPRARRASSPGISTPCRRRATARAGSPTGSCTASAPPT